MATAKRASEAEVVEIIRYPNRRLYDKSLAQYVTLQHISDIVREGKIVVVRDSKSGKDITCSVLTQIVLEQHPERIEVLPVAMLHEMIRSNDLALGALRNYFEQSVNYLEMLQQATVRLNPFLAPFDWMRSSSTEAQPPGPPTTQPNPEMQALLQRIAELEKRLQESQDSSQANAKPSTRTRRTKKSS